jgi:DNA-binding NarL/FixJ family response regulator
MANPIRVLILDDHQPAIDGYMYRLAGAQDIQVVTTLSFGDELEPALAAQPLDVLILDIFVPTNASNPNPYPILYLIPRLLERYPQLGILVISMSAQRTMVRALVEAGANGYVLKDDRAAFLELASIVRLVSSGGIFLSQRVSGLLKAHAAEDDSLLTSRQAEILSYCAAYPDVSTAEIARQMNIANSTVRNLLSNAYLRLEVSTRAAAIAKARQIGLISQE